MRKAKSRQRKRCFNLWKQSPPPIQMHSVLEEKDNPRMVSSYQALMVSFFGKISGPPEYFKTPFDLTSNKHWTDCWLGRGVRHGKSATKGIWVTSFLAKRQWKEKAIWWQDFICWLRKAKLHGTAIAEQDPSPSSFILSIITSAKGQWQVSLHLESALHVCRCGTRRLWRATLSHHFIRDSSIRGSWYEAVLEPTFVGPQGLLYSPKQRLLFGNLATRGQHWLTLALKVPAPALLSFFFKGKVRLFFFFCLGTHTNKTF